MIFLPDENRRFIVITYDECRRATAAVAIRKRIPVLNYVGGLAQTRASRKHFMRDARRTRVYTKARGV